MGKDSFIIYHDTGRLLGLIPDDEAGKLFKALFAYHIDGISNPEMSDTAKIIFEHIREKIDKDDEKYRSTSEQNRKNRNKQWHKYDDSDPGKYDGIYRIKEYGTGTGTGNG